MPVHSIKFKNRHLRNQKAHDLETWYVTLGPKAHQSTTHRR